MCSRCLRVYRTRNGRDNHEGSQTCHIFPGSPAHLQEWGYAKSKELLDLAIDKSPRQRAINLGKKSCAHQLLLRIGPLAHIEKYGRSESKKHEAKSLYMEYHIKSLLEERELLIDLIYRTKQPMVLLPEGKFVHHKAADVPTGCLSTKPFPKLSKNPEPLNNYERQEYSSDNSSLAGFLPSRCLPTLPENPERCATDNLEQTDSLTHYNSYKKTISRTLNIISGMNFRKKIILTQG